MDINALVEELWFVEPRDNYDAALEAIEAKLPAPVDGGYWDDN